MRRVDSLHNSLYDVAVVDAPSIFLLTFLVSMGLTIVMFALGVGDLPGISGHGHGGVGHDVHIGHHLDIGGHGAQVGHADASHSGGLAGADGVSPLNMATILAFVTWFSGSGYLLTGPIGLSTLVAIALATGVGLVGATIVFVVLVRVLLPGQTPYLRAEDFEMEGTIGRLAVGIRVGGTGELVFSKGGARRVTGARSADGDAIEQGAEVVVIRQERGIAYVQPFSELLEESSDGRARDV